MTTGKRCCAKSDFVAGAVCEIELHKGEIGLALQDVEARFLQLRIVIVVDDIEADDLAAGRQQALRNVESDKARGSGDQQRIDQTSVFPFEGPEPPQLDAGKRAAMATRTHTNLLVRLQRSMTFSSTDKVYASRPAGNAAVTVLTVRRLSVAPWIPEFK